MEFRQQARQEAMAAASSALLQPALLSPRLPSPLPTGSAAPTRLEAHGLSTPSAYARALFSSPSDEIRKRNSRLNEVKLHKNGPRSMLDSDRAGSAEGSDLPPPGCSRIKVELSRPLGIAFEETKIGTIVVDEVIRGGNAESSGLVEVGDQLIATSAVVYSDTDEYQGVVVRKGMQIVRLNVRGERFETVMAAIGTHPAYIKVTLELQKCEPVTTNGAATNGTLKK